MKNYYMKPAQTKITIKVYEPLINALNKSLNSNFIKRDSFLNHMIKLETPRLEHDMKDLKLSNQARRYISGELKRLGTKTLNVVVDKDTSESLKKVISETNIVRDSFINRLILMLLSPEDLLQHLEIPTVVTDDLYFGYDGISTRPLKGINTILEDPLFYLRTAIEYTSYKGIYTLSLPNKLTGMSCYLENRDIPGTKEFLEHRTEMEDVAEMLKNITL